MTVLSRLPGSLVLRTVQSDSDIEQYIQFNTDCNNPFEGAASACLLRHHPGMTLEDFWLVEDTSSGKVVSTTCLIPWQIHLQGLDLKAAQLEMVLTHPEYRGRGLVRAQIDQFHQDVSRRGFDLSFIWGIPYFYRQFGYTYAIDGNITDSLSSDRIPEPSSPDQADFRLRAADLADAARLTSLYSLVVQELDFYAVRTKDHWAYLLGAAHHPVKIIEAGPAQHPTGYVVLQRSDEKANILEAALPDPATALHLLHTLKLEQLQEISIAWPRSTPLVQTARNLGSQVQPGGQWLVRSPDLASLLQKMAPLFESRLEKAGWSRLTDRLVINLYRQAYAFSFKSGRLGAVRRLGFKDASMGADGGDLCIPPEAFTRLMFGYRTLEELSDAWPDINLKPEALPLVGCLFPKLHSYLYAPYHFLGQLEK